MIDAATALKLGTQLRIAGFHHYTFVSYANTDAQMKAFAQKFQRDLENRLRQTLPVLAASKQLAFLDNQLKPGTFWEQELGNALCHSLTLTALCIPMYANSDWCGREWQAMKNLGQTRIGTRRSPIFVIRLGQLAPHPVMSEVQQFWMRKSALKWLPATAVYDDGINHAVDHILDVLLDSTSANASCDEFRIGRESAFDPELPPGVPNRV